MKILLTGASGYIGAHLHSMLCEGGQTVAGLDLRGAKWNMDLRQDHVPSLLGDLIRGFDLVIHLAAEVRVNVAEQEVFDTFHSNIVSTINVLEATVRAGVPRFMFTSTGETRRPPSNLGTYALTKLHCEQLIERAARRYGLDAWVLRLYNVCGGLHVSDTHLIPNAIKALCGEKMLTLFGGGECMRDYVSVVDVCHAITKTIAHMTETPDAKRFNTFEVGTGKVHTANDIVSMIEDITQVRIPCDRTGPRPGDDDRLCCNPARWIPGWEPKLDVRQVLESIVAGIEPSRYRRDESSPVGR